MKTAELIFQIIGVLLFSAALILMVAVLIVRSTMGKLFGFSILIMFCLQACSGHNSYYYKTTPHDTGTYYRYRAVNLMNGRIELVKIDTVWDVYRSGDTVYLDKNGFISKVKENIVSSARLEDCMGTVTLVDDTLILSATHIRPHGDNADIELDVPPPSFVK